MTIIGAFSDGKDVTGQMLRLAMMAILNTQLDPLAADGGVRMNAGALDALKVIPGASGLTVVVKPGLCVIPGTDTNAQGPYFLLNDANLTVALTAADGSQSRWDRIVARVVDNGDSTTTYTIIPVTGTPAGSPSLPATPPNSLKLGAVLVPPLAATPGVLTITDERKQLGMIGRNYTPVPMYLADVDFPEHTTINSTFRTMQMGVTTAQYPQLYVQVVIKADTGTTGEIKVTVNDVQLGATQVISDGAYAYLEFPTAVMPGWGTTINYGSQVQIRVALRRVSGTGNVGVRVTNCQLRPVG